MRIAEIAPPWFSIPPTGYGGIEMVVDRLVHGLHERGHEVTLFAPEGSVARATVVSPLEPAGAAEIGDPWFETQHTVSAYLRQHEFDLVHDHTLIGTALGSISADHVEVVHTLHGPWTPQACRYYGVVDQHVHLVAISNSQRAANPDVRYAATIPNGIDLDAYPLYDGPREDYLVYIGRANRDKAPERAVELAHKAGRPLKLVVKRSEPDELEHWQREVEPLLGPDDELLPELSHDEKVELLQHGHAFIFPIRWQEPFGLVMIEALACGLPVIATPRGAATEIIVDGETGFLRDDIADLAAVIDRVTEISPEACRSRVTENFSAEAMVRSYEHLFSHVTATNGR